MTAQAARQGKICPVYAKSGVVVVVKTNDNVAASERERLRGGVLAGSAPGPFSTLLLRVGYRPHLQNRF